MDFMVDAFLCLVLDVFGLASIESAVLFPSVGLISGGDNAFAISLHAS
jgi:hypothetical protein